MQPDLFANNTMRIGHHRRRSCLSRSNRPDRLISNRDLCKLIYRQAADAVLELLQQDGLGPAAFALFQPLSHTHNRPEVCVQRSQRSLENGLIGLAEILPPL